jgi:hypothetical protein
MTRTLSPGYLAASQSAVTVGTSSTAVLGANYDRNYLLLVNDGTEAIYVSLGGTAALNTGIRINANGGSFEMTRGFGNLYQGALTAICASGGMKLLVTEGT